MGCNVVVSQLFGAGRIHEMKSTISTAIISLSVLGLILMALGTISAGPLLELLGTDPDIMADSQTYLRIYFGGAVFLFLYNTLNGIYNAQGDSKTPLIFLMISSLTNIVLDLLFVIRFHMGVAGVAWATIIAQAVSGMMEMTGEPDGPPNKIGSAIGDWMGALNAFGCIGTALYYRSETGEGQHIDISLARSLMWMAAKLDHGITGEMQTRTGNHHSNLAPYGIFKGRNNQSVVIGVLSSKLWETFCKVMQRTELINDPRFVSNDKRVENKQLLIEIIEDWLSNFEQVSDAIDLLMVAGVPCSKIYNMKDIDEDPHFNQCGWIADMPMADGMTTVRTRRFPSDPFKFSAFEPVYGKAPALGEQNHEVLEALGFTAEEVDEMEAEWEMKVKNK